MWSLIKRAAVYAITEVVVAGAKRIVRAIKPAKPKETKPNK